MELLRKYLIGVMNVPSNMPGIEKVLNICEYALEQCLNMLEYMAEIEPKTTLQVI